MIIVKVMRLNKNGIYEEINMKFKGTKEEYKKIDDLSKIAEDCCVDQLESWK